MIQRGPLAKLIKRAFAAPPGSLNVKMDYSAHEVRMWGIVSGDMILCKLFVVGRWLRQMYRKTGKKVYKALMDTIGDIHKINCVFFEMSPTEAAVTKDQRDQVKSIAFGAIYGRGANAIARQVKKAADVIKKLMEKFFKRFVKAAGWLERAKKDAREKGYTVSPIGRVRHLFSQWFGDDNLTAGAERRGANAPIQGIAADLGHTGAYLYEIHLREVATKFKLVPTGYMKTGTTGFVHDAIKTVAEYKMLLVAVQVLQWCATIGVCEYYTKVFGMKFHVEPEIEIEIGASDDSMQEWDWHEDTLRRIIREGLEKQAMIYPKAKLDVDKIEKEIWSVRNEPVQAYLDKHYPVLPDWKGAMHIDPRSDEFRKTTGKTIREWTE